MSITYICLVFKIYVIITAQEVPMSPVTPPGQTRRQVLRFVRERLLAGAPPTVREVQIAFGFRAVQTARAHLEALVGEGALVKLAGRARGYRLPEGERPVVTPRIPILGRVQAGSPHVAVEEIEGWLPMDGGGEDLFALKVRGDSMRDAGILSGDIVVVRRQPTAEPGEIVVALIDDEATVKRFALRQGQPVLLPANPDFAPIAPPAERLVLLGKVVELRRRFDPAARELGR